MNSSLRANVFAAGAVLLAVCASLYSDLGSGPLVRNSQPIGYTQQGPDPLAGIEGIEPAYPRFARGDAPFAYADASREATEAACEHAGHAKTSYVRFAKGDEPEQPRNREIAKPDSRKSQKLPREASHRRGNNQNAQNIQINGGGRGFSGNGNGAQNVVINGGNRGFSGFSGRAFSSGCRNLNQNLNRNQAQNIQINGR